MDFEIQFILPGITWAFSQFTFYFLKDINILQRNIFMVQVLTYRVVSL
jgi:hypothetical protein